MLKGKIQELLKYHFHPLYLQPTLEQLIENLSRQIALLNLLDSSLANQIWLEAFDTTVASYFFNFLVKNRELKDITKKYGNDPSQADIFELELRRITVFFGHFVKGKQFDNILVKCKLMTEFFKSEDCHAAVGYLKSLVMTGCIKSNQVLVTSY